MSYTQIRSMTTGLLGPTKAELAAFLEDVEPQARISVHYDRGYNQLDAGSITFSVTVPTNHHTTEKKQ